MERRRKNEEDKWRGQMERRRENEEDKWRGEGKVKRTNAWRGGREEKRKTG